MPAEQAAAGPRKGVAGCLMLLVGFALGFAALQGGIVLTAWALHRMLASFASTAVLGVFGGIVLIFAAPRLWTVALGARPEIGWRQALASLPDFSLAGWFVLGWAAPHTIGTHAAGMLVGIMVLEFIIIHASVMLVALPQQLAESAPDGRWWKTPLGATAGLLLIYSLFAAAISAAFSTIWLFLGFWMLFLNKFIADWLSPPTERALRRQQHMARWASSAVLYLLLAFGSIFIPVPRLAAFSVSDGDGLWETHPEQAIAMGALYFAILAFFELYGAFNRMDGMKSPVR